MNPALTKIVDSSFEAGFLVNEDGSLMHMNGAAEGLLEFAIKQGEEPSMTSVVTVEGENGAMSWPEVMEVLQVEDESHRLMGYCTKKSGEKFDADIKANLVEIDQVKTATIYVKPVETETRFDHMTRYMSTLLNMLTSIIDTSLDPIFQINEEGVIQMVNECAISTFGWERDEFIGANISMICGGDHAAKHAGYLKRYLQTGETRAMGKKRELPARRKDGTEFPIELGLVEIFNDTTQERMFVGFLRDLTEIKRRERLSSGIIAAAFDPMFTINEKGIIEFANDAAVKEFGFKMDEFLGHNISMIVGSEHAPNHDKYIARYLETGEARVMGKKRPLKARRKDGSEFPIELGLAPVEEGYIGEGRLFCGFVRNLDNYENK